MSARQAAVATVPPRRRRARRAVLRAVYALRVPGVSGAESRRSVRVGRGAWATRRRQREPSVNRRRRARARPIVTYPAEIKTHAARTSLPWHVYPGCTSSITTPSSYSSEGTCWIAMCKL